MNTKTTERKVAALLVVVILLLLSPILFSKNKTNPSHFGFEFGSTYDDCFKAAKERFGDKVKVGLFKEFKEEFFNTQTKSIYIVAKFSEYEAINLLGFTPRTKKLYQISHHIPLPRGDARSAERMGMIFRLENALKKKYGKPMPMDLGIPQPNHLALAKGIPAVKSWMVKSEGIGVTLVVRNEVEGQDNELMVSYSGLEMLVLGTEEGLTISKDDFKDL